ncbi:MAG: hypothetical protein NVSMB33_09300 [Ktedonobacteraceae bacterium]
MQVAPMNHKSQPLVSVRPLPKIDPYKGNNTLVSQWLHSLSAYLLTIPAVALVAKIGKVVWQILAFIISLFASKTIVQQPETTSSPVIVSAQKVQPSTDEYIQETQQMKDHFLIMASHELKTPMTTILGQAQLMLRRLAKMPELSSDLMLMRSGLESIDGQTRRLNTLVNDLLDLYNIRAGKVQLHLTPCNFVNLCHEAVTEQRLLNDRTIELEAPLKPIVLQADCERLRQVIVNLLSNAIKYSPEDSPVKVLVDQRLNIGILEVTDCGVGISKEQQTHIFEPFYRGPDVEATSKSGMGLGLAISKDIVERHQGRIWCRSRPGKGSIFIVEVPLSQRAV